MDGFDEDHAQDVAMKGRGAGAGKDKGAKAKGRGSRRGASGGGAATADRDVLISKALSRLLRHQALFAGIKLDDEGFARLDQVMQWKHLRSLNPTFAEIRQMVADNAKQRFTLKAASGADEEGSEDPKRWLIRANQGHSIKLASEALHTPITLEAGNIPDVVVHGTYFAFWPAIVASGGLEKMGRQHVHFGTGIPGGDDGNDNGKQPQQQQQQQVHDVADELVEEEGEGEGEGTGDKKGKGKDKDKNKVISGMRADAEVLVFVDVARSLRDGALSWWLSANGVVLTEGDAGGRVPARYFSEARGRRQGVGVLWRDGEKVADLPEGVVARVPVGKTAGGGRRGGAVGR